MKLPVNRTRPHHGQDCVQSVWEQGDEDPDAGSGRSREDHHSLQTQVGPVRQHHSNCGLQRRDSHIQKCQIQCLGGYFSIFTMNYVIDCANLILC